VVIEPVNDAPVATADAYSIDEDGSLVVAALQGVLANDSDVEGTALTAQLLTAPAHGGLSLAADGSFVYTPDAQFSGADSFTYQASDGVDLSAAATVSLTVNAVNDPPVAVGESYDVFQNGLLDVPAVEGLLANDYDIDSLLLTTEVVALPSHGTLSLNPDGSFTYAPDTGYFGDDFFLYRASDGGIFSNDATVTLHITELDDDGQQCQSERCGSGWTGRCV
jgi:VCBS repeat-containing protein